jgi:hypothetical protein
MQGYYAQNKEIIPPAISISSPIIKYLELVTSPVGLEPESNTFDVASLCIYAWLVNKFKPRVHLRLLPVKTNDLN